MVRVELVMADVLMFVLVMLVQVLVRLTIQAIKLVPHVQTVARVPAIARLAVVLVLRLAVVCVALALVAAAVVVVAVAVWAVVADNSSLGSNFVP